MMNRRIHRVRHSGDSGASLVFVLVVISVLAIVVGSLSSAISGGFKLNNLLSADSGLSVSGKALTQQALEVAAFAADSANVTSSRNGNSACYAVSANGSTGSNYIDYPPASSGSTPTQRVFCKIYSARVSNSTLVQTNKQPDIADGIAITDRMYVCGSGNYYVQGQVDVGSALNFYTDTGCTTARSQTSTCPQATAANEFSPSSGSCPALYVHDANSGDGIVNAVTCSDTKAIYAESGTNGLANCPKASVPIDTTVPSAMPTSTLPAGLHVVDMAGVDSTTGAASATCTDGAAVLRPGAYDDGSGLGTIGSTTTEVSNFLNGLGGGYASCVTQASTLSAAATNLSTSLSVTDRRGFLAGDTLTVGTATFTVNSTYAPAVGAGAIAVTPTGLATNALSSVRVGTPLASLSVAATVQETPASVATSNGSSTATVSRTASASAQATTSNSSTTVSLLPNFTQSATTANSSSSVTLPSVTTATATWSSGQTKITLSADNTNVAVGQFVTSSSSGIPDGTTVTRYDSRTKTVSLSNSTTAGQSSKTVTFWPGTNPAISVGQFVTGQNIPSGRKVSALTCGASSITTSGGTCTTAPLTAFTLSGSTNSTGGGTGTLSFWPATPPAIAVGQYVVGGNVPAGRTVASLTGGGTAALTGFTLSGNTNSTGSGTSTLSFYPGTFFTTNDYLYYSGSTGSDAYTVNNVFQTTVAAGKNTLTFSTGNTGANGTTDSNSGLRVTKTVISGSTQSANTVAVGDVLDFFGSGNTTVDDSTCYVTSVNSSNKSFTCVLRSDTAFTATTLTAGTLLDKGPETKNFTSGVSTYPSTSKSVAVTAATAPAANDVLQLRSTGDSELDANDCTVAASPTTSFTCTLATAPTVAFSGTSGSAVTKIALANSSAASAGRQCIAIPAVSSSDRGTSYNGNTYGRFTAQQGSWCNGSDTKSRITSLTSSSGSATFTATTAAAHGLTTGDWVAVNVSCSSTRCSNTNSLNGTYQVTVTDSTHFTFQTPGLTSGSVNITNGTATEVISSISMLSGSYMFDLENDWRISSPAVSIEAGVLPQANWITNTDGSVQKCIPSYSPSKDSLSAGTISAIQGHGVTLTFGGQAANDGGLRWAAGNMLVCPKPVNVDSTPNDRPVAIYGPGSNITGTVAVPAYYNTGGTSSTLTVTARADCSYSATSGSCDVFEVPSTRGTDDGTSLLLFGSIFSTTSRVSLRLNFTNDDQMSLYGIVAKNLRVVAEAVPTGTTSCASTRRSGCRNGGTVSQTTTFVRFTAYPCSASYNGAGVCTLTTAPDASWVPPGNTQQGFRTRTQITAPAQTISAVSGSGSSTTVTVTTSAVHGLSPGTWVTLTGLSPAGYNGTVRVATVPSTTTFTYTLASALGSAPTASSGKVAWLPDSCPPQTTYPWVGCMTVKFDPSTLNNATGPVFVVVGPYLGATDCIDPTASACWAILA